MPKIKQSKLKYINTHTTKAVTLNFSRTFRHYITPLADTYTRTNQGWSIIPYEHICSSLKPSDWQTLNAISRKWTPISCGFKMHHIVPIQLKTNTSKWDTPLNMTQSYLETFTDKDFIIPIRTNNAVELPNSQMLRNNDTYRNSRLLQVRWNNQTFPKIEHPAYEAFSKKYMNFELMNSWNWNILSPETTFGYTWKEHKHRWRHATIPSTDYPEPAAEYNARWDGGIDMRFKTSNKNYTNKISSNFNLIPTCLVRPMDFEQTQDDFLFFQVLITYTSKVLALINDVRFSPLYTKKLQSRPDIRIYPYAFIGHKQWCGSNCHNITSGPHASQAIV